MRLEKGGMDVLDGKTRLVVVQINKMAWHLFFFGKGVVLPG